MMLTSMREVAEAFLGYPVKNAMIIVPAYLGHSQRRATKDAKVIYGFHVLQNINKLVVGLNMLQINNKPTKIPKVQPRLQDFFNGKELCKSISPN